jgi:hypothetical protein
MIRLFINRLRVLFSLIDSNFIYYHGSFEKNLAQTRSFFMNKEFFNIDETFYMENEMQLFMITKNSMNRFWDTNEFKNHF